jgi:D-alanine-D-alanine ligase
VSILKDAKFDSFEIAVEKAFFRDRMDLQQWDGLSREEKIRTINTISDIRTGIGFPMRVEGEILVHPEDLFDILNTRSSGTLFMESIISEDSILIESFINGEEFSCIVIENEEGKPIALPPTQILKRTELFDYRAKYLPGISRKITPINLPASDIQNIRKACEQLFVSLNSDVYARIDGFIGPNGIYLNDPNTTSGMMPSSFFFHQAAEIGMNPSQFLTFIIRTSLRARLRTGKFPLHFYDVLRDLDQKILNRNAVEQKKESVAVIMGGFSSERHISVESGRNIYEKLSSSKDFHPFPVFLTGNQDKHELYSIPVNIMLKDNADDIRDKILNYKIHPVIEEIRDQCKDLTSKYTGGSIQAPEKLDYDQLANLADAVFIALHGRPGEDGTVQKELEKRRVPYNGSLPSSSEITINKFETNEILARNGVKVASHAFVKKSDWQSDAVSFYKAIEAQFAYPLIAKPADDGCSSAVTKVKNREMLEAYVTLIFRDKPELDPKACEILNISVKEEFPVKEGFVIEHLINRGEADHFLEITGGLLTHMNEDGTLEIEMFEPSETLATGDVLTLEEKFLAGEGQNITPARYDSNPEINRKISEKVKAELKRVAGILDIQGYARIDAFVKIYKPDNIEVYIIEINSLPGMTPATCIFHQCAINEYTPLAFISEILKFGKARTAS